MRYYFIAGETSGDQHLSEVVKELKQREPEAICRGIGGTASEQNGLKLFMHQKELAVMGFIEVLLKLPRILRILKQTKRDILLFKPQKIVLVDYPGYNLKIARFAKAHGIQVHYYIAPKAWAWKEGRVKTLKAQTDYVYSILPFEKDFFAARGLEVQYVGNPSKVAVEQYKLSRPATETKQVIALLPGSRRQEIQSNLHLMSELQDRFPDESFAIAQAPGFDAEFYESIVPGLQLETDMYSLLSRSKAAVVTSGTATLETALHDVPQLVCYRTSALTYAIARTFVKVPYISLVNLILNKESVVELIQKEFNLDRMTQELASLLETEKRVQLKADYSHLRDLLEDQNPASAIVDQLIAVR